MKLVSLYRILKRLEVVQLIQMVYANSSGMDHFGLLVQHEYIYYSRLVPCALDFVQEWREDPRGAPTGDTHLSNECKVYEELQGGSKSLPK